MLNAPNKDEIRQKLIAHGFSLEELKLLEAAALPQTSNSTRKRLSLEFIKQHLRKLSSGHPKDPIAANRNLINAYKALEIAKKQFKKNIAKIYDQRVQISLNAIHTTVKQDLKAAYESDISHDSALFRIKLYNVLKHSILDYKKNIINELAAFNELYICFEYLLTLLEVKHDDKVVKLLKDEKSKLPILEKEITNSDAIVNQNPIDKTSEMLSPLKEIVGDFFNSVGLMNHILFVEKPSSPKSRKTPGSPDILRSQFLERKLSPPSMEEVLDFKPLTITIKQDLQNQRAHIVSVPNTNSPSRNRRRNSLD